MLLLAAVHRVFATPGEAPDNDLMARARAAIGHVGLTLIALVFMLLNFWSH